MGYLIGFILIFFEAVNMRVLYLAWTGHGVDYMSSLFLPIFQELKKRDIHVNVVNFTWSTLEMQNRTINNAYKYGIKYKNYDIYRNLGSAISSPLAIIYGSYIISKIINRDKPDVIMPRVHLPAAMCLLAQSIMGKIPMAYDSDGLVADERVDFGNWTNDSIYYKIYRNIERISVRRSRSVITRSTRSAAILGHRAGVRGPDNDMRPACPVVIEGRMWTSVYNGRDPIVFSPLSADEKKYERIKMNLPLSTPIMIYVGSIGPQYHLGVMCRILKNVQTTYPDAYLIVLSPHVEKAKDLIYNEDSKNVIIKHVQPDDVHRFVKIADFGFALREPSYSQQGVSPIKVGEYLLCGVPVISNYGIGDMDKILDTNNGYVMADFSKCEIESTSKWIIEQYKQNNTFKTEIIRASGLKYFEMNKCVDIYEKALRHASGL